MSVPLLSVRNLAGQATGATAQDRPVSAVSDPSLALAAGEVPPPYLPVKFAA